MSLELFRYILAKKWPYLISFSLLTTLLIGGFTYVLYQPEYEASALLVFDDSLQTPEHQTPTSDYIAVLKSDQLFGNVLHLRTLKEIEDKAHSNLAPMLASSQPVFEKSQVEIESKNDGRVVQLTIHGQGKQATIDFLQQYLTEYERILKHIYKHEPQYDVLPATAHLDQILADAQDGLSVVEGQITDIQKQVGVADLSQESQSLVADLLSRKKTIQELDSWIAAKEAEIESLHQKLNVDSTTAIDSIAKGQSPLYTNLLGELNRAKLDYRLQSLAYKPDATTTKTLKEKIAVLNNQIQQVEVMTVGHLPKGRHSDLIITDSVRANLANRLALAEADQVAYIEQQAKITQQTNQIEAKLAELPKYQAKLAQLLEERGQFQQKIRDIQQQLSQNRAALPSVNLGFRIVKPLTTTLLSLPKAWVVAVEALLTFLIVMLLLLLVYARAYRKYDLQRLNTLFKRSVHQLPNLGFDHLFHDRAEDGVVSKSLLKPWLSQAEPYLFDIKLNSRIEDDPVILFLSDTKETQHMVCSQWLGYALSQAHEKLLDVSVVIDPLSEDPEQEAPAWQVEVLSNDSTNDVDEEFSNLVQVKATFNPTYSAKDVASFKSWVQEQTDEFHWVTLHAPPVDHNELGYLLAKDSNNVVLSVGRTTEASLLEQIRNNLDHLGSKILGIFTHRLMQRQPDFDDYYLSSV